MWGHPSRSMELLIVLVGAGIVFLVMIGMLGGGHNE